MRLKRKIHELYWITFTIYVGNLIPKIVCPWIYRSFINDW